MENPAMIIEACMMLALGIALAASCGFRVFIPLFVVSLASMTGYVELSSSFEWLSTWPALLLFGIASLLEVVAYYFPVLDNALDTISVPASAIAGTVLAASFLVVDISPLLKWTLALIAGGGTASLVNMGTASVRGASTTMTAGLGNAGVATVENAGSVGLSIISIFSPIIGVAIALVFVGVAVVVLNGVRKRFSSKSDCS